MTTPSLDRLAKPYIGRVMALDPGQTTGWSYWDCHERVGYGQETISDIEDFLNQYLDTGWCGIDQLVFENYRVYPGREKVQGNLYTPRLIGRIEAWAEHNNVPVAKQMAAPVKRFCSDEKLKDWGLYVKGQPHANDATRHAAYFLVFSKR